MKYEYHCKRQECGAIFILNLPSDSNPKEVQECPYCGKTEAKRRASSVKAHTKEAQRSKVLSHKILDKRIGEDADKKWEGIQKFHNELYDASKELGTEALTRNIVTGKLEPMDKEELALRKRVTEIMKSDSNPVPVKKNSDGTFSKNPASEGNVVVPKKGPKRKDRNIIPPRQI